MKIARSKRLFAGVLSDRINKKIHQWLCPWVIEHIFDLLFLVFDGISRGRMNEREREKEKKWKVLMPQQPNLCPACFACFHISFLALILSSHFPPFVSNTAFLFPIQWENLFVCVWSSYNVIHYTHARTVCVRIATVIDTVTQATLAHCWLHRL